MARFAALILLALCLPAHAALRGGTGPTMPTNPTPPTGGGSPTLVCVLYPLACLR